MYSGEFPGVHTQDRDSCSDTGSDTPAQCSVASKALSKDDMMRIRMETR